MSTVSRYGFALMICVTLVWMSSCALEEEQSPQPTKVRVSPTPTASPTAEKRESPTTAPVVRLDVEEPMAALRGTIKAYEIRDESQLAPGLLADGFLGDLALENDLVRAIVRRPDPARPAMPPAGAIVDLVNQKSKADYLNYYETIPDVDSTVTRIRFERVESFLVDRQTTARLVLSGKIVVDQTRLNTSDGEQETSSVAREAEFPFVRVRTTYELAKNAAYLVLTTRFTNESTETISLSPGDYVDWGEAKVFVEGQGLASGTYSMPHWLGAYVDDFSAGICLPGDKLLANVSSERYSVVPAVAGAGLAPPALPTPAVSTPAASQTFSSVAGKVPQMAPISIAPPAPSALPPRPETHYRWEGQSGARIVPQLNPGGAPSPGSPRQVEQPTPRVVPPHSESEYAPRQLPPHSSNLPAPQRENSGLPPKESRGGGTSRLEDTPLPSGSTSSARAGMTRDGRGRIRLAPGQSYEFTRYLIVGDRNFSRVSEQAYRLKNMPLGLVAGVVVEDKTNKPIPFAEIRVSGGPKWDGKSTPIAFTKGQSRADGTFVLRLPYGSYYLTAAKVGREMVSAGVKVDLFRKSPDQYVGLVMSRESFLQVAVSDPEAPTSAPLPARLTILAKPGTEPIDWGYGPGSVAAVRNIAYMPYGAASLPVTPGHYRIYISRGPEYDAIEQDVVVTRGSVQKIVVTLARVLREAGTMSCDLGVMTTASANALVTPEDLSVMAACEGVAVLVTGDFDRATDLTPTIAKLGLTKYVKCIPGMRFLVSGRGSTANLLVYPVSPDVERQLREFKARHRGEPPDVVLAELRKEFPNLVIQVDQPLHPLTGYLASFPFNERFKRYEEGNYPPPDFHALQVLNGKLVAEFHDVLDRYFDLAIKRTRWPEPAPALTPLGSSMCRLPYGTEVGYPRVYALTIHDTLDRFTGEDLAQAVVNQRVIVTNGIYPRVQAYSPTARNYAARPGDVVDTGTTGALPMKVNISAASWVSLSNFDLTWNGKLVRRIQVMPVNRTLRYPVRQQKDADLQYVYVDGDGFMNLLAFSNRRPLSPIVPPTLPDFGGEVWPLAWTGPIFVDQDRNGKILIAPEDDQAGGKKTSSSP